MGPLLAGLLGEIEGQADLLECLDYFGNLWKQRQNKPDDGELDFVSALANSECRGQKYVAADVAGLRRIRGGSLCGLRAITPDG